MTIMIADNRACAHAVTDLLNAKPAPAKRADRQQGESLAAYFFGHYDSRGGAAMVIARNHIEAMKKYAEAFFCTSLDGTIDGDGHKAWLASQGLQGDELEAAFQKHISSMTDAVQEDFLFKAEVIVCDAPLPADGGELDAEYCGKEEGFKYGRVQSRYEKPDRSKPFVPGKGHPGSGKFYKWTDCSVVVLWKGRAPKVALDQSVLQEEFRVKRLSLGEDACGLVLIP